MQALSEASLDEVNESWAGLGYYRRARFLLQGAQAIAARKGCTMPRTAPDWLKIPGRCPQHCAPDSGGAHHSDVNLIVARAFLLGTS